MRPALLQRLLDAAPPIIILPSSDRNETMDWRISAIIDAILAPAAVALLVAYHAFLCYKVRTRPMQTVMGINQKARRLWVYEMIIENHKKNVLAVQTIRNSLMESTLMATTAVLFTAALATYFTFASGFKTLPAGGVGGSWASSAVSRGVSGTVKSFAVLACLMASFLCHTQSIRFFNHVSYMVNIPLDRMFNPEYVADLLERATVFYALGSRSFYVAFPLLLWVFGSIPMFLCALVLLHALYNSDFVNCAEVAPARDITTGKELPDQNVDSELQR